MKHITSGNPTPAEVIFIQLWQEYQIRYRYRVDWWRMSIGEILNYQEKRND